jgi:uncharacterized protein with PQ loop repeat
VEYHYLAVTIGWIAVALMLWGTVSQFKRARRLGVEGVSLATWSLFILLGCFWITYGIDQHSAIIIVGSAALIPLQLVIVFKLCRRHARSALRVVAQSTLFAFALCVVPTFFWGWPGGIYGAGVAAVSTRAPQIIELLRDPDVTGVSVRTWVLVSTGSVCWMIYYENARQWAPLVATSFSFAASVVIALLASWRQRQARVLPIRAEVIFT